MSVIRLVMVDTDGSQSAVIPSSSIPSLLWGVSQGASQSQSLWQKVAAMDPALEGHFTANRDPDPLLEGVGDGLLVISWPFHCIESFQAYLPLRSSGTVRRHNGRQTVVEEAVQPFALDDRWHIIDHYFEESRH